MSKFPPEHHIFDISDYMRLPARFLASIFQHTPFRAITFTWLFFICGIAACTFFIQEQLIYGSIFFVLKILFDTVDGEIARLTKEPRYTGRYLDSICDFFLNAGFFYSLWAVSKLPGIYFFLAFISMTLQCSLYNYYYVCKRAATKGDTTSRVKEYKAPTAYSYESQFWVNVLHKCYLVVYGWQDWIVHKFDTTINSQTLSCGFLTAVSVFGLGTQLAVILACFLVKNSAIAVYYFLIASNIYMLLLIVYRKIKAFHLAKKR